MSAFDDGVEDMFEDPHMAVDAIYRSLGTGAPRSVRLIISRPDEEFALGNVPARLATAIGRVRISEVPNSQNRDTYQVGPDIFTVQGSDRNPRRTVWNLDFR